MSLCGLRQRERRIDHRAKCAGVEQTEHLGREAPGESHLLFEGTGPQRGSDPP